MGEFESFLDAGQVAAMLRLSVATIRRWVMSEFIPYRKIGRAVRFSEAELREWAQGMSVTPPESRAGQGGAVFMLGWVQFYFPTG